MTRVASAADSVTTRERARKTAAAAEAAEVAEVAEVRDNRAKNARLAQRTSATAAAKPVTGREIAPSQTRERTRKK